MKFRDHKYEWTKPFSTTRHQWSFRGPRGGIHFHVSIADGCGENAGLEFHRSFDPTGGKEAPSQANCWLLQCPCWHDGTSLYATEELWPMIRSVMPDHEIIFRFLEKEYDDHFDGRFKADAA